MTRFNTRPTRARLSRLAFRFSRVLLCMCAVTYTLQCQPPPAAVAPVEAPMAVGSTQMVAPVVVRNPMALGFDLSGSDHRAVEIADRVMARLGGREGWEHTRYLTWRFFGKRRHVWDKWTGDLRFEAGDRTVLMNLNDRTGRSWRSGLLVEDPDTLAADVDGAYRAWIKDSYWLVMPYKLKDSGVTLRYKGQDMTEEGIPAHVLELTFQDVGVTPQNRYQVWVDIHESLVRQWSFYRQADDSEPRFVRPWQDWQSYGRIWLASDFGGRRHSEVGVFDDLPASVFDDPGPTSFRVDP
ncbi:MAG: hypothetical protein VX656_16510 [Candidatus Latescibacterota bacterium]|nr:hypothetical protein [Candidatus Latescibacterota bacterium]